MGLEDFVKGNENSKNGANRFSSYSYDEREENVWDIIERFQDRFPEQVRCDMVEIAPYDVIYNGMAYYRSRDGNYYQYMRISESIFEESVAKVESVVLHEMIHLYLFQNNLREVSDGSPLFKWLCGRVGCVMEPSLPTHSKEWKVAEQFLEDHEINYEEM